MKKYWTLNRYLLIPFFALSLALAGCSGDDGSMGPQGPQGEPGEDATTILPGPGIPQAFDVPAHALSITAPIPATVEEITINNGEFTLDFTVDGLADPSRVQAEFTIAKWVEAENSWISMLQRNRIYATGDTNVVRAGNLRVEGANFISANPDGSFSYTFVHGGNNIDFTAGAYWTHNPPPTDTPDTAYNAFVQGILTSIATNGDWDEDAVYRVGVTSRQGERFTAIAYVTGDGTPIAVEDAPQQISADTLLSCLDCHGDRGNDQTTFSAHSNRRHDPQLCTSCHNAYTYDSHNSESVVNGWAHADMMSIVHKIHAGIDGYMIAVTDYSGANFPDWLFGRSGSGVNGTQNCTACHKGAVPADGQEWNITHSVFTCASCHVGDTLAEAYPSLVGSGPHGDDDVHNCADCHSTWTADTYHGISPRIDALDTARSYLMEIVSVENAVAGQAAQVTWRVQKDGDYQNLFTGGDTYLQDAVRLGIGWGYGDDWTNDGSGAISNGDAGRPFQATANATNTAQGTDNTYAVTTFPALPAAASEGRNGFAVVERGPSGINASSAVKTFILGAGDAELGNRREIVSTESCLACHATIGRHGTYADVASGVTSCVTCHNAGSLSRDASVEQGTVDFMYIVHAIHGVGEKRSKFDRRRDHGYDYVTYPSTVTDCTACHVGDSHKEVDYAKRLGVIANEGKDLFLDGQGVNSPYASVCYSCHQDDNETYRAHFLSMSANMLGNANHAEYFEGQRAETCSLCHW